MEGSGIRVVEVAFDDPVARRLRREMVADQLELYAEMFAVRPDLAVGATHEFAPERVAHTVLAERGGEPAGQANLLFRPEGEMQVKRVFVRPGHRRAGVSRALMAALEELATAAGAPRIVLSTGPLQPAAAALYPAIGYRRQDPYGDPAWHDVALYFEKPLRSIGTVGPPG